MRPVVDSWRPPGPAWLFCPGDRPERFRKAAAAADIVVLDLEDGVSPARRQDARRSVASALTGELDPVTTVVRINPPVTRDGAADLDALRATALENVMIPKAALPVDLTGFRVVPLCETARGILDADGLAGLDNCVAVALGGEDLAADLGLGANAYDGAGTFLEHARLTVRYASAAHGRPAIDTVCATLDDESALAAAAERAALLGFDGKLVIHPQQVPTVRAAFRPNARDAQWARDVVDAAESSGGGATVLGGQMLDAAVLRRAQRILAQDFKE